MRKKELTNSSMSPLRYPGGKGKITRFVDHILDKNGIRGTYAEPFAGGAGIAVKLLLHQRVERIIINDLDDGVYSFWQTVIQSPDALIRRIRRVPFDFGTGLEALGPQKAYWYWYNTRMRYRMNQYRSVEDKAFDFFMLNRMNVSGIVKGGPIGGESQDGQYNVSSRFNKRTLIQRIESIADVRDRIIVTQHEASYFLRHLASYCNVDDCLVFADPPYFVQGRNLYSTFATDCIHKLTAGCLLDNPKWRWILTYDEAPEINLMYPDGAVNKYEYNITYSANKRGSYKEFLFADLRLNLESFDNVHLHRLEGIAASDTEEAA